MFYDYVSQLLAVFIPSEYSKLLCPLFTYTLVFSIVYGVYTLIFKKRLQPVFKGLYICGLILITCYVAYKGGFMPLLNGTSTATIGGG